MLRYKKVETKANYKRYINHINTCDRKNRDRIDIWMHFNIIYVLVENRKCTFCHNIGINVVEDEIHVLLHCPLYIDIRQQLFIKSSQHFANFYNVDDVEKIRILLNVETIVNFSAKTCFQMLEKSRNKLYTE